MKLFRLAIALAVAIVPATAAAQTAPAFNPQRSTSDQNPEPRKLMCWNSGTSLWEPCAISGSGSGSGAATPTGTAGSPNAQVVSVQGVAGGTPQPTIGNVAAGAADSGAPVKIGGRYNATMPTLTDGQRGDLPTDARGAPFVVIKNSGGSNSVDVGPVSSDAGGALNALAVRAYQLCFDGTNWPRCRGDTNGQFFVQKGGSNFAPVQVAATTTAQLLVAARAGRQRVTFSVGAANTCAFGPTSAVTLTTGYPLQPVAGASSSWETNAAIYVVCSAATTVSAVEFY